MQFRHAVDGFGLYGLCRGAALIFKGIDGAIFHRLQPPRAAQVHHANAARERFRHHGPRLLMRRGKQQHLYAFVLKAPPIERLNTQVARAIVVEQVRMQIHQRLGRAAGAAQKQGRMLSECRVVQQQARQLHAGVAADSHHRNFSCLTQFLSAFYVDGISR